jgi:hypothetical protein
MTALLWHYNDADATPPLYVTLAKQNKRPLQARYVLTKSISETDSLHKKHYARLHPQLIFPRLHEMYTLKVPEDVLHILHTLDLYQKETHTLRHKSTRFGIKYSLDIYVTPKNLTP